MKVHFTPRSGNSKTGDIPVTISASKTCPPACPFRGAGCYADIGPLMIHWRRVDKGEGISWDQLCKNITELAPDTV